MKHRDSVDDEGEDVGDRLGAEVRQRLVVGCRNGGENFVQWAEMVKFLDGIIIKAAIPLSSLSSPVSL